MEMTEIIEKINSLNALKKERELTSEESEELAKYRQLYLQNFKANMRNILENTKVINEDGEDITPKKKGKYTMSATTITILVGAVCLLLGVVGGFYLARRNFMNYMEKNPQINEEMVMSMMSQMGQKPSRKKINQVMSNMQKAQQQARKQAKK